MNPYRTEKVLVDIRKRSLSQPIAVVASTDVEIELSVMADGSAHDCTGLNAVFYMSKDGQADTFSAVEAKRGKLVFRIPAAHLGYPGEYRWQVIVSDGEKFSEWARGDFFIRANPAADFEPMQLLDPPFVKVEDFEDVEEVSVGTLKNVTAKVNELVRILKGAATAVALALLAVAAHGVPFDEVLPATAVNTNLIGAAVGDGLSLSNGVLSATGGGTGGSLTTNDVEAIARDVVSGDEAIVRYEDGHGVGGAYLQAESDIMAGGDATIDGDLNVGGVATISGNDGNPYLALDDGEGEGTPALTLFKDRILWRDSATLFQLYFPTSNGTLAITDDIPSIDGLASSADVADARADASAARTEASLVYQLLMGSNVVAEVTNYNSRVRAPQLRLLQLDQDTKEYFTVWTETNGLARTLAEANAHTDAATNTLGLAKADRAWSKYTSGLGADAPSNTTWVSTPLTVIAGGYEYARYVTTAGEAWVLTSNGMAAGPDTNAYFRVASADGETLFSVEKTDSVLIGVDASGITCAGNTVTIPLDVVSADPPVCYACDDLVNATWHDLTSGTLPAWISSASCGGEAGAWVWTITTTSPRGFFQFRALQEGSTVIRNNAITDLSQGILINGVKYMPVVSGTAPNRTITWTEAH